MEHPYGPLVDYVSAVTKPVMKERAPKPSGLRDLIDRQKGFYKSEWFREKEKKFGKFGTTPPSIAGARGWAHSRRMARSRMGKSEAIPKPLPHFTRPIDLY